MIGVAVLIVIPELYFRTRSTIAGQRNDFGCQKSNENGKTRKNQPLFEARVRLSWVFHMIAGIPYAPFLVRWVRACPRQPPPYPAATAATRSRPVGKEKRSGGQGGRRASAGCGWASLWAGHPCPAPSGFAVETRPLHYAEASLPARLLRKSKAGRVGGSFPQSGTPGRTRVFLPATRDEDVPPTWSDRSERGGIEFLSSLLKRDFSLVGRD